MNLVKNPKNGKVYLDAKQVNGLYAFDGTPYSRPRTVDGWEVVSREDVPSLWDWQRDPGKYGPYHVVASLSLWRGNKRVTRFTAGGSFVYIRAWMRERPATAVSGIAPPAPPAGPAGRPVPVRSIIRAPRIAGATTSC